MLPERLREARTDKGYTQEEVADQVGIQRPTYTAYESGRREPNQEILVKIARFLNVSSDYLLGLSDIKTPIETIAAHRMDDPTDELPEEARKSLEEFKDYILKKYGYKE